MRHDGAHRTGVTGYAPFYVPLTLLLGGALYVAGELLLKHLTLRNLQTQLRALPADIAALPTAPRIPAAAAAVDASRNQRSYAPPVPATDTLDAMPAMQFDTESVLSFS
jgi:hypothetical protein